MNDCIGDIGVAVWIALRRAHQGGVTNLAGQWRDCGSPVPGYLADALDRLTSSGQLALAQVHHTLALGHNSYPALGPDGGSVVGCGLLMGVGPGTSSLMTMSF